MKRKVWGGILIALPIVLLPMVLTAFAISNFVISQAVTSSYETSSDALVLDGEVDLNTDVATESEGSIVPVPEPSIDPLYDPAPPSDVDRDASLRSTVGNLINVILGFLGIIAVGGFFVFIPWGIYLLSTDGKKKK